MATKHTQALPAFFYYRKSVVFHFWFCGAKEATAGPLFGGSVDPPLRPSRRYLIFHLARFTKNNFYVEKNPTIVNFPVKNLELKDCESLSLFFARAQCQHLWEAFITRNVLCWLWVCRDMVLNSISRVVRCPQQHSS